MINVLKPEGWAQVTQHIRQNAALLEVLNKYNARFDKPIYLDDKDWLQSIFSTVYNLSYQDEENGCLIITYHAFCEPNLTREDSGKKLRVYFYTLPEMKNDKLKEEYEEAIGKFFPDYQIIEGVQIHGSNHTQTTIKSNGKSTGTNVCRKDPSTSDNKS